MEKRQFIKSLVLLLTPIFVGRPLIAKPFNIDDIPVIEFGIVKEGSFKNGFPTGFHFDQNKANPKWGLYGSVMIGDLSADKDPVTPAIWIKPNKKVYLAGHYSDRYTRKYQNSL